MGHAADDLLADFLACRLPKPDWTHEAHVTVCWALLRQDEPASVVERLRVAIRRYNDGVGTPNTDDSGYHETLTCYYVGAVGFAAAYSDGTLASVLASAACSREAPLRHWSRPLLFSVDARRDWLPPDLEPLPFAWPPPPAS